MSLHGDEIDERARRITLVAFDVDGVCTDGRLYYGPDGCALHGFHARDGLGIVIARKAGIVLVGTNGRVGETYVLGGELTTLAELVRRVAAIAGRPAPRFSTPTWALRAAAPVVGRIGPNLGELVSASAGVTYWATDAKARSELGYAPRDLERGLTEVFAQPS